MSSSTSPTAAPTPFDRNPTRATAPWILLHPRAESTLGAVPTDAFGRGLADLDRVLAELAEDRTATGDERPSRATEPRGDAHAFLLPLLELGRARAGDDPCVVLPADLRLTRPRALREGILQALRGLKSLTRATVLLGMVPGDDDDDDDAWILPAEDREAGATRPVTALLEASSTAARRELRRIGGLVDSSIVIGRVGSLLALYKDFLPHHLLPAIHAWLDGHLADPAFSLPPADLRRDLLARAVRRLRVVELPRCIERTTARRRPTA